MQSAAHIQGRNHPSDAECVASLISAQSTARNMGYISAQALAYERRIVWKGTGMVSPAHMLGLLCCTKTKSAICGGN